MKIINYSVVVGSALEVSRGVCQMMRDNWEPYGNPMIDVGTIAQAMVKYEEKCCGSCHTEDPQKPYCVGGEQ